MNNKISAKTKIVCTIGPSVATVEKIVQLIDSGMDVARLNLSHGTHRDHNSYVRKIRRAAKLKDRPIGIMLDLQGPKIRIGKLKTGQLSLNKNDVVVITSRTSNFTTGLVSIPTNYKRFSLDVKVDDVILIDDGKIEMKVLSISGNDVKCKVLNGGLLLSNKGMNLPTTSLRTLGLTEKDKRDLLFGIEHEIDYFALSFVRSVSDIKELKQFIAKRTKRFIPVIAKIEKPEALEYIVEIINSADGIIVARGDLGIEVSLESVPLIQKDIIQKCKFAGKPVIVATQMLESMINNPRPTRAEVSDVANAVIDGADAVMLSGETSIGKYPINAVIMMDKIIKSVERKFISSREDAEFQNFYDSVAKSVTVLSDHLNVSAIVAITYDGETAIRLSKHKPSASIIAITKDEKVCKRLNLYWGINSIVIRGLKDRIEADLKKIGQKLLSKKLVENDKLIILMSDFTLSESGVINTIKLFRLKN